MGHVQSIHLLLKKEEIRKEKLSEGEKVAVVLDVLLATTTIISALHNGARQVIPVLDPSAGIEISQEEGNGEYVLAGELNAAPVDDLIYPSPTLLRKMVRDKTLILSTTNGTVALRNSAAAKKVYIASLLNNPSVAEKIKRQHQTETIIIVCSGNSGEFSLEDFYGAGHLIDCLMLGSPERFNLNDAAKAASALYRTNIENAFDILQASYVGQLFNRHSLIDDLKLAANKGSVDLVPEMVNGRIEAESSRQEMQHQNPDTR
ncbi:2-phosphosulfolactate phosphatase [Peribacillus muralis]|uniref:2-phosphosulfolactate phosphatase n=1 Tax=Peribacillus muralis TaxID=264697 RepID=UPI001F4EA113|nr:2-phosphosulfolactate phosphatase [Peribacillus muralis]MCK1992702.1 2-phosphosulfolactate phosphatase [Peribacillus muralis]MCK2013257.1 2-phosphosulfolactate phosphatase [Peribacillus muralis]